MSEQSVEHALLCADAGSGKAIKVLALEVRRLTAALAAEKERVDRAEVVLPSEAFKAGCQKNMDDAKTLNQKLYQANSSLSASLETIITNTVCPSCGVRAKECRCGFIDGHLSHAPTRLAELEDAITLQAKRAEAAEERARGWQYEVGSARSRAIEAEIREKRAVEHSTEDHAAIASLASEVERLKAEKDYDGKEVLAAQVAELVEEFKTAKEIVSELSLTHDGCVMSSGSYSSHTRQCSLSQQLIAKLSRGAVKGVRQADGKEKS